MAKKEFKSKNLFLHGVGNGVNENLYVQRMLVDIRSEATPTNVVRIGEKTQGNNRPLKVQFSDVVERDDVLGMIYKLKDNDKYKKVNITEDLTKNKRNIVKSWLNLAKQKNNKEPQNSNFVWRLRGRMKTAFFLKKIQKTLLYKQERFIENNSGLQNCIALIILIEKNKKES